MATIKVKFRPSVSEEKEGKIYYQVIQGRIARQVRTEYKIFPFEWNERRKVVTCKESSLRLRHILLIRERIKNDLSRFNRIIRAMERDRTEYTADEIIEEYTRIANENSLFGYMNKLISKLKSNGRIRTSEAYKSAINSFRRFRDGEDIMLESISKEVMESYESWLRHNGLTSNTVSFYLRILRAVYNRAVDEDLIDNRNPFKKVYTGIEKTVKRALPMKVIKQLRKLDLALRPAQEFARDMFLLSFMLRGMSLVDMAFLRKTDLQNGHLSYRRRKTGQLLTIRWTAEMQGILDKYPANNSIYLLPIIKNPQSAPIYVYRHMSYIINRHLKEIANEMRLPITLTMYVARHSWASAAKARGIPLSVISEGMGHDSELTTQIYLASLDTSVVDNANLLLIKDLNKD